MKFILPAVGLGMLFILAGCVAPRTTSDISNNGKPLRIAVISDLNSGYGSVTYNKEVVEVVAELARIKPDVILCAGDMVAGQKKSLSEENIWAMWQGFKSTVLLPLSKTKIPFGFTLGNHDASPSFAMDRSLALQFWTENVQATNLHFIDSSHYPFYFSYLHKNIFFLSWDAAGASVPTEVYEWMKGQLASKIAHAARLRILLGHLPLYPIVGAKNKPGEVIAAADIALNFFKNNNVDLYISGHQHAWYPAKKNGLSLLNAGCIGDGERPIIGHSEPAKKAYSIIEIPAGEAQRFSYRSYNPVGHQIIDSGSLPDSVVGFNGVVEKDIR